MFTEVFDILLAKIFKLFEFDDEKEKGMKKRESSPQSR
jgi:hypothetical protein